MNIKCIVMVECDCFCTLFTEFKKCSSVLECQTLTIFQHQKNFNPFKVMAYHKAIRFTTTEEDD